MSLMDMNWEKSAVVVIDMQNDFCLPDSVMPVEGAMDVAPVVAEILETARKYKMPIVHIVRLYKTDGRLRRRHGGSPRTDPKPAVYRRGGLGYHPKGEGTAFHSRDRQRRYHRRRGGQKMPELDQS